MDRKPAGSQKSQQGCYQKKWNESRKKSKTVMMRDKKIGKKHLLLTTHEGVVACLRAVITVQVHHTEILCKRMS